MRFSGSRLGAAVFAALVAIATVVPAALAQEAPPGLTVVGNGTITAAPDVAQLNVGVQTVGQSAQQALADNGAAMRRVTDALRGRGIADADIQTSGINVYPQMGSADTQNGPQQITGYVASNSVNVRLTDPAQAGDVLDAAIAAGANTTGGITFGLKDESAARRAALDAALKDARAHADAIAASLGKQVGDVIAVTEDAYPVGPIPYAVGGEKQASTPVQPGSLTIGASVRVTYAFK
jgi:uncharacterized protein YggE